MKGLARKLTSRKLWVAGAGMAAGVAGDNPVLTVIAAVAYVIVEGLIDAFRRNVPEAEGTE